MGRVEAAAKTRRRKRDIQYAILSALGVAGVISLALLAPNVFQALPRLAGDKFRIGYRARTTVGRLAQKGLVRYIERNGVRCVELTKKGERRLAIARAAFSGDVPRKRWDGRHRLVMFDVPQYRRGVRDRLRRVMRECGFLRVQDSVWLYPYDCEELLTLIKAELRVGKDVLYAVVESLENDGWIKNHFGLKG
ncbi:MAG: hypothetical protein RLZZ416_58 [Candidatus Parcubacteria bacterium]|jgi:predicted transcriptional regulator